MDSRQAVDEQAAAEHAKAASAERERREQDDSQRSAAEPQAESPGAEATGEDGAAARELAVGLLDLIRARLLVHPERLVVVGTRRHCATSAYAATTTRAGRMMVSPSL